MREPFFSICIPQYNRTSFLLKAIGILAAQQFKDFEVCISDDCSPDGRQSEVVAALEKFGLAHRFSRQANNLKYDGNLRAAIGLASGRYCLLMGNDDGLADSATLERLHALLVEHADAGVALTNSVNAGNGVVSRRVPRTSVLPGGAATAAACFRNFSFVSGVILLRERAQAHATSKWDGAEMYQMYLGSRILAEGYSLLEIADIAVVQNLQVEGETVDSYATRPRVERCPIKERKSTLTDMGRLVIDAIAPYSGPGLRRLGASVLFQLWLFPYPFWTIEYRKVQSWRFAAAFALGMRPRNVWAGCSLSLVQKATLGLLYCAVTATALAVPQPVFHASQSSLYRLAKSVFRRSYDGR